MDGCINPTTIWHNCFQSICDNMKEKPWFEWLTVVVSQMKLGQFYGPCSKVMPQIVNRTPFRTNSVSTSHSSSHISLWRSQLSIKTCVGELSATETDKYNTLATFRSEPIMHSNLFPQTIIFAITALCITKTYVCGCVGWVSVWSEKEKKMLSNLPSIALHFEKALVNVMCKCFMWAPLVIQCNAPYPSSAIQCFEIPFLSVFLLSLAN